MIATSVVSIEDAAVNKTDSLERPTLIVYVNSKGHPEVHRICGQDVLARCIGTIGRRLCTDIVPDARVSSPTALLCGDLDELIPGSVEAKEFDKAVEFARHDPEGALRFASMIRSHGETLKRLEASLKENDELADEFEPLFSELSAVASVSPHVYDVISEPDRPNVNAVRTMERLFRAMPTTESMSVGDLMLSYRTSLDLISAKRASIRESARKAMTNDALNAAAAISLLEDNLKEPIFDVVLVIGDLPQALRSKEIPEHIANLCERNTFDVLVGNPVSPTLIDLAIESFEFHQLTPTFAWTPVATTLEALTALGDRFSPKATISASASVAFAGTLPHHGRHAVAAASWLGLRGRLDSKLNPAGDLYGYFNPTFGGYNVATKEIVGVDDAYLLNNDAFLLKKLSDSQRLKLAERYGWNTISIEDKVLVPFRSRTRSALKDWQQADGSRGVRLITAMIRRSFRRLVASISYISREIEAQRQLDSILGLLQGTDVISVELEKSITSTGRRLELIAKVRYLEALETISILRMVQSI